MTGKRYEKIKKEFGTQGSWAIWNPDDPYDTSYIDTCVSRLDTGFVFVGINPSRELEKLPAWTNYHLRKRGAKERKLSQALGKPPYEGSYMTDIIKDSAAAVPALLRRRADNTRFLKKCANILEKEFALLGKVQKVFLFGNEARILWEQCVETSPALNGIPFQGITHFAAHGSLFEQNIARELAV